MNRAQAQEGRDFFTYVGRLHRFSLLMAMHAGSLSESRADDASASNGAETDPTLCPPLHYVERANEKGEVIIQIVGGAPSLAGIIFGSRPLLAEDYLW